MIRTIWASVFAAGLTALIVLEAPAAQPSSPAAAPWKAGVASVAITPEQPQWMAGYAGRNKPSEGKFQDLFAKALALEDPAGTRLVIVTLDLIGIPRTLRDSLEKHVREKYRLPPESLMMNASHTHSGPLVRVGKKVAYDLKNQQEDVIAKYAASLERKLESVVGQALKDLAPAKLGYCHARAGFAINRRLPTPKGYQNSPNPDGPVDHDVPLLRVDSPDGKLRAVLFGYACHNTTLGLYKFCGDYAGYAQQYLEEAHPGAKALFMIGCGADQNPYPRSTVELAQQHGRTLATAVEAGLLPKPRVISGTLRARFQDIPLEFGPLPTRDELLDRQKKGNAYEKRRATALLEELTKNGRLRSTYPYPIHVVQFGDELTLVALAGEVVVDYSLRLKRELGGSAVWVAGYSNDVFAYIPSLRVLNEGGYEAKDAMAYTSFPAPWAPSIEEKIVAKVREMVLAARSVPKP